ncbi:MAG: hypothetical protein EAZ87_08745 [Nostocales cyanobacterium]|nr:MAG: hypothetical protein EAZ87_08745 [Nostocales cyanobacterium]
MPNTEKIEMPEYDNSSGIFWGLAAHWDNILTYKELKKRVHEIDCNNTKIGNVLIVITHDSGNGEKRYSHENLYKVLNEFGENGWEIASTNTDYYFNDESRYDIEKRYFLKEILNLNDDDYEDSLDKISLTRTKYLMKKNLGITKEELEQQREGRVDRLLRNMQKKIDELSEAQQSRELLRLRKQLDSL